MHDGDPQIHLAGNVPGAGKCVVKSIRPAAACPEIWSAGSIPGTAMKVLRFINSIKLKRARRVDVRHTRGKNWCPLVRTYAVEQDEVRTDQRHLLTGDL